MRITADTNILLRILTEDHPRQTEQAKAAVSEADMVVAPNVALCEVAWVLGSSYGLSAQEIAGVIRNIISNGKMMVDHAAVEAGLAVLEAGGDFADGVIAYEGRRLGAETFASFDRKAVALLQAQGVSARLLK